MATIRYPRFDIIEVPIPAGSTATQFNFPDQPQLRNAKVIGIEWYNMHVITKSPVSFNSIIDDADAKQCFVTLMQGNLEKSNRKPLATYNRYNGSTIPNVMDIDMPDEFIVSWVKSYITLAAPAATTDVVVVLGVYFIPGEE